jgi:hypothetical protein
VTLVAVLPQALLIMHLETLLPAALREGRMIRSSCYTFAPGAFRAYRRTQKLAIARENVHHPGLPSLVTSSEVLVADRLFATLDTTV